VPTLLAEACATMVSMGRWWIVVVAAGASLGLWLAAGVVLCESAVHVPKRAMPDTSFAHVSRRTVQIIARDGAVLRAWLFTPEDSNGNSVMVLHGISDSRAGVMGLARLFVENHYTVLAPDNRGHGESGGGEVTYGLREADDVHRWVDWLIASQHPRNLYGMGESLGAAVLLEALGGERRFSAVVAECPFADFESVAEDRVAQRIRGPQLVRRSLAVPMVWSGFLYARIRYGLDFRAASPETVISRTRTPVLLIHGLADTNIYPAHSEALRARNPQYLELWLVPGAVHTAAYGAAPLEFPERVLGWFADHAAGWQAEAPAPHTHVY
jgi:dipeptidyl aminopeptidase/acylaminoacyl peptidase